MVQMGAVAVPVAGRRKSYRCNMNGGRHALELATVGRRRRLDGDVDGVEKCVEGASVVAYWSAPPGVGTFNIFYPCARPRPRTLASFHALVLTQERPRFLLFFLQNHVAGKPARYQANFFAIASSSLSNHFVPFPASRYRRSGA